MAKVNRGKFDDTMAAMYSNPTFRQDYLFYAHMIGLCSVRISREIPAAAGVAFKNDHYDLYINPDLFDKETVEGRLGILKHEMLHILNGHVERKDERIHLPWNWATDCAINQLINADHIPDWVIKPHNYGQMIGKPGLRVPENESSEFYYDLIEDEVKKQMEEQRKKQQQSQGDDGDESQGGSGQGQEPEEGDGQPQGGSGQGKPRLLDNHDIWQESEGDKDLQKDITRKMIEQSQNETIKGRGTVPNQCSGWIALHSRKSEVNWKKVLRGIVGNKRVGRRSTIMRSDRRFPKRNDLRGHLKDRTFNLLVIADVSGSMSDQAILYTIGEVRHICDMTKTAVDLIQIDTQAYKPEKLDKKTQIVERKGNGGTTLHPALEMAKEHNIDYQAVVVLTDGGLWGGDIDHFANLNKKVIWLIEPQGYIMDEMNSGKMIAIKLKESEINGK